ncbi:MAG TPA: hypothetical protein VLJ76_09040 [Gaiellaceae bacterium]|nr:hypothetical protein [Gaiellaceae bacterium]
MLRRFRDLGSTEPGFALAGLIAVALAALGVASALAYIGVSIIQQHVAPHGGLEFHIGHTSVEYEDVLQAGIVVALVGVGLYWGQRLMAPAQQTCPDCLSSIPVEARVCRYCTSDLGPADRE